MSSDLTFITNEGGQSLLHRFTALIKDTRYFYCLVGYFYASGFYSIYKSLEKTEKIRVLIGISADKETFELISESKKEVQQTPFIHFVDQILSITKDDDYLDSPDKQAKVKRLEKEIDQLVYKLYELTPEDIKIVEGFGK